MLLIIILVLIVGFILLIAYASITNYRPAPQVEIAHNDHPTVLPDSAQLTFLSWNIGYAGLSSDMDFFYDGGKQVRTSRQHVIANIQSIGNLLKQNDTMDFILLQEIDLKSKRSYYYNEIDSFSAQLPAFNHEFSMNYDVFFVPVPPRSPLGKVKSGIITFSRFVPQSSVRYAFPGNYAWPKSLFMLDRCFMVNRYPVKNGKELLVINSHNSAYDDGSLRKRQMEYLKDFLLKEYEKGNYIIVGADWNQSPPGYKPKYRDNLFDTLNVSYVPENFLPKDWSWVYCDTLPTNRRVVHPYNRENTLTTTIDFFLISPNVRSEGIRVLDEEFQHSDHEPVVAKFALN